MEAALQQACDVFRREPNVWRKLVTTGMRQDWSWGASAKKYVDLYKKIAAQKRGADDV